MSEQRRDVKETGKALYYEWEFDEMQRAARRHQREAVPYPSQMNSAPDNFEDVLPAIPSSAPTERNSHA
ncbi:hypothetical protein [Bdellovibrio sp.]|uniref:hypothetical protein n=1 Tax=Bdellovibrio TaxID=958 RepID=UPI003221F365